MTLTPSRRALLTTWRRRLFFVWIAAAIVAALAAAIGGPIVSTTGSDGTTAIALLSPLAMFVFVVTALAWLVLLALTHRSKYETQPPP